MSDTATELRNYIATAVEKFNEHETKVLFRLVRGAVARLSLGRERYGPLDLDDARNWDQERREEAIDLMLYDAMEQERAGR